MFVALLVCCYKELTFEFLIIHSWLLLQECNADDKLNELVTFLLKHKSEKVIVFLATCAGVTYFSTIIER